MKSVLLKWARVAAGLLVFAFGVHLTIFANIGLAPWDCLGMGIAGHTPFSYGTSMMIVGIVIICVDLLLGERIGFGSIIDALLTGHFVQLFNDLNPFPLNTGLISGAAYMIVGFVFMALGMWIYMSAGQGCGPRDALLVGLGRRLPALPIGLVEILIWSAVLLAGWLLGGPVGPGTLISTFGAGLVIQLVYSLIRFEPRNIRHQDVLKTIELIRRRDVPNS